jgi:hypothetical protein
MKSYDEASPLGEKVSFYSGEGHGRKKRGKGREIKNEVFRLTCELLIIFHYALKPAHCQKL